MRNLSPMTENTETKTRNPSSEFVRTTSQGTLAVINANQLGLENAPDITVQRKSGPVVRPAKWALTLTEEMGSTEFIAWFATKSEAIAQLRTLWSLDKDAQTEEE